MITFHHRRLSDADPAGSAFAKLTANSSKQTNTSITLKWAKVKNAKKYVVYANNGVYKKIKITVK